MDSYPKFHCTGNARDGVLGRRQMSAFLPGAISYRIFSRYKTNWGRQWVSLVDQILQPYRLVVKISWPCISLSSSLFDVWSNHCRSYHLLIRREQFYTSRVFPSPHLFLLSKILREQGNGAAKLFLSSEDFPHFRSPPQKINISGNFHIFLHVYLDAARAFRAPCNRRLLFMDDQREAIYEASKDYERLWQ